MISIELKLKRIMDIVLSVMGIMILLPVFVVLFIAVKTTSTGPAIFYQERLGKNGKVFRIMKFRTMVVNAEKLGDGLSIKTDQDPRITPIGHFLRKSSLDELPQLFNILCGDMSIVGPRPPVTYYPYVGMDGYPDWAKVRFMMKPGLTGLAQVEVRNSVSWDERIKVDIKYVQKFSLLLDLKIMLRTFSRILSKENIYMTEQRSKGAKND